VFIPLLPFENTNKTRERKPTGSARDMHDNIGVGLAELPREKIAGAFAGLRC
jgi:hypothetical protein